MNEKLAQDKKFPSMIKIKNIFSSHKRKKNATSQERSDSHNLNTMIKVNINRGKPDIYASRDMMRCKKMY